MAFIATVLLVSGLGVDLLNLRLGISRLRGNGPSGIPLAGLAFCCAGLTILCFASVLAESDALVIGKSYLVIHLLLNYGFLFSADAVLRLRRK